MALQQGIDSLNPFLGILRNAALVQRLVYDYITDIDNRDLRPVAGLARSWSTSPDGLTWTYSIRTDARWSDGKPLTAADLAFTYNLMLNDPAARMANGIYVSNFDTVVAPDDVTLVIRTKTPSATMLSIDVPIIPQHVWRHVHDIAAFGNLKLPLVGSGPFELVDYRADEYLRFRANHRHWRTPPKVEELVLKFYKSTDAAVQALRRSEVDIVSDLTPAQYQALDGDDGIARNTARGTRFVQLGINVGAACTDGTPIGTGHPALRDEQLRRAMGYAIDKEALVERPLGGHGEVGAGYLPPVFIDWSWSPEPGERRMFDPSVASRILDEAGYRRGVDGVRTVSGSGQPVLLRLFLPAELDYYERTAQRVEGWLRDVGIGLDVERMASTRMNELTARGDFDLFLGGWGVGPDPDYVLSVQTCGQRPKPDGSFGTSDSFFCDAVYDELYQRQTGETDRSRRVGLVHEMQRRLYQVAAQVILYYPYRLEGYRRDRFEVPVRRPAIQGSVSGHWAFVSAFPVEPRPPSEGAISVGSGGGLLIGVVVLAAATIAAFWSRARGDRP